MPLVIDAHNHIGTRIDVSPKGADLIARMDATGVDKGVIFALLEGNFTNDPVREAADQFPDRLIPFCAVNAWQPDAVIELRRCVEEWGFRGLKLHPTANGYGLANHKLVDPLFAAAEELRIPVIVHGASDLFNPPAAFAEMARTFPNVPLIMAHMGFLFMVDEAIGYAAQYPNLYLETSRVPIFEIAQAVRALGPGKVIWGTNSPFADYEWEFRKMVRATDDPAGYAKIVGGNVATLLKL